MQEYHTEKKRTQEAMPMTMSAGDLQEKRENDTLKKRWAKAVQIPSPSPSPGPSLIPIPITFPSPSPNPSPSSGPRRAERPNETNLSPEIFSIRHSV